MQFNYFVKNEASELRINKREKDQNLNQELKKAPKSVESKYSRIRDQRLNQQNKTLFFGVHQEVWESTL